MLFCAVSVLYKLSNQTFIFQNGVVWFMLQFNFRLIDVTATNVTDFWYLRWEHTLNVINTIMRTTAKSKQIYTYSSVQKCIKTITASSDKEENAE